MNEKQKKDLEFLEWLKDEYNDFYKQARKEWGQR